MTAPGPDPALAQAIEGVTDAMLRQADEQFTANATSTFTSSCAWGCVIRTVDGLEEPHVCVGEQVLAVLAPDLRFEQVQMVAHGLRPLLRELLGAAWIDGVHSGRRGLCYGVDDDVSDDAVAAWTPTSLGALNLPLSHDVDLGPDTNEAGR